MAYETREYGTNAGQYNPASKYKFGVAGALVLLGLGGLAGLALHEICEHKSKTKGNITEKL